MLTKSVPQERIPQLETRPRAIWRSVDQSRSDLDGMTYSGILYMRGVFRDLAENGIDHLNHLEAFPILMKHHWNLHHLS